MSKVYEQIRIVLEHIHKMAFATVLGTLRSQVMQMGDCNAPSAFQQLMTAIFHNCISRFIHVYLDDIFIYSCSIEEHEKHLEIVFQQLRNHHFFLSNSKVDLYSKILECLSHIIDDQGIHVDTNKMQCIREWRCPMTFNHVQHFLGLVQYLAHYMPDISTYTTPLLGCVRNGCPFEWTPLLDKCVESIKTLACKAPRQEWEPSMDKDPTGRHVNQPGSCPRNSVMHNSITEHMSTRQSPCLKPLWSGRTSY